jgi:hypothetical protein
MLHALARAPRMHPCNPEPHMEALTSHTTHCAAAARCAAAEVLDIASVQQLSVPLEALDRYGTMFVDYRGSVPACAGFEMFEMLRKLVHGLLLGAFIGGCCALGGLCCCAAALQPASESCHSWGSSMHSAQHHGLSGSTQNIASIRSV